MVKRTLIVLSILSLMLVAAGTSSAFNCGADCKPLFVPVDCCPYPTPTTIVKTWSCKIEGPCPAPGPMCGGNSCGSCEGVGPKFGCLLANIAGPFEFLFGGCDGVYGCCPGMGGKSGDCGPCFGPVPCLLAGVPIILGSACPNDCMMFGCMW